MSLLIGSSYPAAFFSGAFLANAVPHFVHGISGNPFPSPFAHPPGKGLSSPTVNVAWSLVNFALGYLLARLGHVSAQPTASLLVFFLGVAVLSLFSSRLFVHKHAA